MSQDYENSFSGLESVIGYHFKEPGLLKSALAHSSYVNELKINRIDCYERLEFLGDAVLECVSSRFIFDSCPWMNEGMMSKTRASVVCEKSLAQCARKINLGNFILLGRGEKLNNGADRDSILCDVIEAVAGAIYIDGGFECAENFIMRFILSETDDIDLPRDYKTELQELVQRSHNGSVRYETVSVTGPDHNKMYRVEVFVNDVSCGFGEGSSRKLAEAEAAKAAIEKY